MYISIPKSVEKTLRIYSFVVISLGFLLIVLINSSSLFSSSKVKALYFPGGKEGGDFVNICGVNPQDLPNMTSWPTRSGAECSFECNESACSNVVTICRCEEDEITTREYNGIVAEVCENNCKAPEDWGLGPNVSYNLLTSADDTDCFMWQVDTKINGWIDGNPIMDWVVWKGRRIGDPSCQEDVEQDICPYSSTEAKVKKSTAQTWANSITIDQGKKFNIGSFHNSSGMYASDTQIVVKDPEGKEILSCSTDNSGCNGAILTASLVGMYTVSVKSFSNGDSFYPEAECNASATVNSEEREEEQEQDFTILKIVNHDTTNFKPGEHVEFKIVIENTGDTTINTLLFKDQYNPNYLHFIDIRGRRSSTSTFTNLTDHVSFSDLSSNSRQMMINDITILLGNLKVSQKYIILVTFEAKPVTDDTTTKNISIADDGIREKQDDADIIITFKQPPPTDK